MFLAMFATQLAFAAERDSQRHVAARKARKARKAARKARRQDWVIRFAQSLIPATR